MQISEKKKMIVSWRHSSACREEN